MRIATTVRRMLPALCLALSVLGGSAQAQSQQGGQSQVQRQQTQPYNNAPVWREVRKGEEQYTSVKGRETGILIQSGGETWRALRNGPITMLGGWALVLLLLVIGAYYKVKGTMQVHEPATGRRMQRFNQWERTMHWSTAISFCILAVSGLIILFGKHILLPVIGHTLFAWLTQLAKGLHNFIGPLFIVCAVLLFITFVKDNIPRAYDFIWVKKFGGLFSGEHVPAGRFNAGEKAWFWGGLSLLGIVVGCSGLVLDFPNFDQTRSIMQTANIVHVTGALLFVLGSFGHIYMGTIGVAGAYEAMREGHVDEAWAKEHHEYWYQDVKSGKIKTGSDATASSRTQPQGGD